MSTELKLGPIGQIARPVGDVQVSVAWYQDVLGLPLLWNFGDLAFFDCGGTRLFLSGRQEGSAAGNSLLYFRVEDVNAAYEALRGRGVDFTHAPQMIHKHPDGLEEWMAFFNDPDGQPLAIMAQVAPRGEQTPKRRPKARSLGAGASGRSDTSELSADRVEFPGQRFWELLNPAGQTRFQTSGKN